MKYSIIIIALLIGMTFTANAQTKTVDNFSVQVDGLGCPFCAFGLEKKFKEFKGIKKIAIEMETGTLTFTYPSEKALSLETVEAQVTEAGYTPVETRIIRADGSVEENMGVLVANTGNAEELAEERFLVAGNCGMCKVRIEDAALSVVGVYSADWNQETQQLLVSFDALATSKKAIAKAIAKSGHDSKTAKADDKTYENLPGCCQYTRPE